MKFGEFFKLFAEELQNFFVLTAITSQSLINCSKQKKPQAFYSINHAKVPKLVHKLATKLTQNDFLSIICRNNDLKYICFGQNRKDVNIYELTDSFDDEGKLFGVLWLLSPSATTGRVSESKRANGLICDPLFSMLPSSAIGGFSWSSNIREQFSFILKKTCILNNLN